MFRKRNCCIIVKEMAVMKQKWELALRAALIFAVVFIIAVIIIYLNYVPASDKAFSDDTLKDAKELVETPDPMTISIGMWGIQDAFGGDEVLSTIEKKFNVKLKPVNINYTNWTLEYQKMAASNNLPDIIAHDIVGSSTYAAWLAQKKIRALPSDLSNYPYLQEYMNLEYNQVFKEKAGDFYLIPRLTYPNDELWALDRCIVIRKDWLERLGLELPDSYEKFKQMLKAFAESDFDGNGVHDTIGLATENANTLEAIYLSIFPELSNIERGWMEEDGLWVPVYASKKTGEALSRAKELYDLGLLDHSFPYRSINQAFSLFIDNKSGAICCQYFSLLKYWNSLSGSTNHTDEIIILKPWPAKDGQTYRFTSSLHWSETYFSSNVSDEKMKKIMELYNFLLSEEAEKLFYHEDDAQWIDKNPSIDILSYLVRWDQEKIYEKTPYSIKIYGEENIDYADGMINWYRQNTKKVDYNYNIMFSNIPSKYLLPTYSEIQNEMIQIIIGEEDAISAWNKVMDNYNNKISMKRIFSEITASVNQESLNID